MLGAALMLAMPGPARAGGPWLDQKEVRVRLIAAAPEAPGSRVIGIEFQLEPGWATYWRCPGEAGLPPRFDWRDSTNVAHADVRWPAPERWTEAGYVTFGYHHRVVLPVEIAALRPDAAVGVRLALDFAVCGRVCIPKHADLALDLKPESQDGADNAAETEALRAALARVPRAQRPDLAVHRLTVTAKGLTLVLAADPPLAAADRLDLIAEGPDGALAAMADAARGRDGRSVVFTLATPDAPLPTPLTLTAIAGDRALSVAARPGGG